MTLYDLSFTTTEGKNISLSEYHDKVILIVNTASKCGFAPQFVGLEKLHQEYKDRGLVVIGFPCSQFLGQEPETNDTVAQVCLLNFGVTFTLSQKIDVNGDHTDPIFAYLKKETPGGILGESIKWNFTKFLIDRSGRPFKRYAPTVEPKDIEPDIVSLLG